MERALNLTEKRSLYEKEEVRGEVTIARNILVQCPGHRTSLNVAVADGFDSLIANALNILSVSIFELI